MTAKNVPTDIEASPVPAQPVQSWMGDEAHGGDVLRVGPRSRANTKARRQTELGRHGQMDRRFEADGKGLLGGQ